MNPNLLSSIQEDSVLNALRLAGLSIIVLNSDKTVKWMCDGAADFFGTRPSVEKKKMLWSELIQIDGKSVWSDELDEMLDRQGYLQIEGFCNDSKQKRSALSLTMQCDSVTNDVLVFLRDITKVKNHEEEFNFEKRKAEQLNIALEAEIQKANELAVMAERANIAKSVFLTSMSHEFRTPLNGVLGYAQILIKDKSLSDENHKAVKTIEKSGRHLLSIINDVLDLSKVESGKQEVNLDAVKIDEFMNDIIDVFKVRAEQKGLYLTCEYDQSAGLFDCLEIDGKLIRQVLINLIGNAIKFTDEGGIRVSITNLGCLAGSDKNQFLYSVKDTGVGISDENAKHVFDEFYQTEAYSGHKGGTGLGLAICRKLVQSMGGELLLSSRLGSGSDFNFTIESKVMDSVSSGVSDHDTQRSLVLKKGYFEYIQLLSEDVGDGVLLRIMNDVGFETDIKNLQELLNDISSVSEPKFIFFSIEKSRIDTETIQLFVQLSEIENLSIALIVIQDKSYNEEVVFEDANIQIPVVYVGQPIDLECFYHDLLNAYPVIWDSGSHEQAWHAQKEDNIEVVCNAYPDLALLNEMLDLALIGDLKSFEAKLNTWEESQQAKTVFSVEALRYVNAFKIDDLCQYLGDLIKS